MRTGRARKSRRTIASMLLGTGACVGIWHPAAAAVGAWSPLGPPNGATVQALAVAPSDPSVVYAGVLGGGVQRSDDGGKTWRPASAGLGNPVVNALAVDPRDPDAVYAGTQAGFFRSSNGGQNWQGSRPFNNLKVHAVVVNPAQPKVLFVGTAKGLFRSDDGGANWLLLTVGLPRPQAFDFEVVALAVDPVRPRQVYAAHIGIHNGIHKTVNGGRVWFPVRRATVDALAVDPVHDATVWAAGDAGVLKSNDGGQTWQLMRVEPAHALLIDPFDPTTVYAANAQDLQVSRDGGMSWQTPPAGPLPGGAFALAADPSAPGHLLAGTIGAGVYRSADHGESWLASGQGLVNTEVEALAVAGMDSTLFVGGVAGIYRSLDGGASWNLTSFSGGRAGAIAGTPANPHTLYAAIASAPLIVRTVDGGESWQTASDLFASALAVSLDDPATVYAATPQALMKSADGGATWTPVFQGEIGDVAVDPLDPAVAYLISPLGVWRSNDRGSTWERLLHGGPLRRIAIGRNSPRTILVSDDQSVFGSTDGGETWSVLATNRSFPYALAVDPTDARFLYIGTGAGAEQSADNGMTWRPFNRGLFGRGLTRLLFDPNDPFRLYAGTSAAGLFVFEFFH